MDHNPTTSRATSVEADAAARHQHQSPAAAVDWSITFWGTGDSMGVPRVYCACEVCEEARRSGVNRRYRSSVLLERGEDKLLIDCGPDWTGQMERAAILWLDELLITHAHQDHIAGLTSYADACRWLKRKGRVITPTEVSDTIRMMYPWLERFVTFQSIEEPWRWHEWSIRPIRVNHGKNGYAYAYRFDRVNDDESAAGSGRRQAYPNASANPGLRSWVYASDAIGLGEEELRWFQELDLLILGTNFYHEQAEYSTRSVYDMVEAFRLIEDIQPQQVVFTHMSHDIDLRHSYPLLPQVTLARTGMRIGR
ncbi:MBL fold metallo-hydrolase [Paenibacillus sp. OSY-SE]|uniref:MBL fold metallo-hydrolase n=1 Tax=Paenibacillus sp. OSY-SE TaxID=1196323 RepID=UPI0002E653A2